MNGTTIMTQIPCCISWQSLLFMTYVCCDSNFANIRDLHPLEVVGRGSETQLQVSENLNYLKRHNQAKKKKIGDFSLAS